MSLHQFVTLCSVRHPLVMNSSSLDAQLFSDEDFRFRLGTILGSAVEFFAPSEMASAVLGERRSWLRSDPSRYVALLPEGEAIAGELLETVARWPMLAQASGELSDPAGNVFTRLVKLGESLEPDFVLLAPRQPGSGSQTFAVDQDQRFTVAGGCVCFPSMWRLTDKLGQSVNQVHEPVPQLNAALGPQIDRLLAKLRPGKCLVRSNWSICRSPELNQHPDRNLPSIPLPVRLEEAWLRREDQCLFALPETGGIVFGIRVSHTSWGDVQSNPQVARSVAHHLRTMPQAMLVYKRLDEVSEALARLLDGNGQAASGL